jgi:superoxide reductase
MLKFYKCKHCGKIITFVNNKGEGIPTICCGEPMTEIIPNTNDGALEKHVPVISIKDNVATISVGSVEHPSTEEHHIEWILLQTKHGNQRVVLKPNQKPSIPFPLLPGDSVIQAFAYCNLHSLWAAKVA